MLSSLCRSALPLVRGASPRIVTARHGGVSFTPALVQNRASSHGHGHGHSTDTVPGENLPFDINNKYKLTLWFMVFFGSALAIPFLAVRHQLLKQ